MGIVITAVFRGSFSSLEAKETRTKAARKAQRGVVPWCRGNNQRNKAITAAE
jgi:hypothetical protein